MLHGVRSNSSAVISLTRLLVHPIPLVAILMRQFQVQPHTVAPINSVHTVEVLSLLPYLSAHIAVALYVCLPLFCPRITTKPVNDFCLQFVHSFLC